MRNPMLCCLVGVLGLAGVMSGGGAVAQEANDTTSVQPADEEFVLQRRPGSVDLGGTYDLSGLTVPEDEIHTLLPRDAIPSLTDPSMDAVGDADWLEPGDRVISVVIGEDAVAVPLRVLNFHEIANMTVGGEPVAATYCPLCDSASVISRRVLRPGESGKPELVVLEFGVSGALYNSNVLMYDRTDMGLWSQLGMRAVSGPLAGMMLEHLPVRVVPWSRFAREHPDGRVVNLETGHERPYERDPYSSYFDSDRLLVSVRGMGEALERKTLGVGVMDGAGGSWFVPASVVGERYELKISSGTVVLASDGGGVSVESAPDGVHTIQTLYYSWSAFNRETVVIEE